MGEKHSSMQFYLLRHGPNGMMASFLVITIVLTVRGVCLMVIMLPTIISLDHGEVPHGVVLIS
jgi:hypothetical protein